MLGWFGDDGSEEVQRRERGSPGYAPPPGRSPTSSLAVDSPAGHGQRELGQDGLWPVLVLSWVGRGPKGREGYRAGKKNVFPFSKKFNLCYSCLIHSKL